jgi:hypothetical protein
MAKAPSVLICGAIRNGHAFAAELQTYFRWRDEGLVDRLVFSGWLGDRGDGNINYMVGNGVEVTLAHEPVLKATGHILHQLKNLHFGLDGFDDDELILRCRTDKTPPDFDIQALTRRFHAAEAPASSAPFSRRLVIPEASPLQAFFYNDMKFMGLAGDIRKLVSFDIWWELEHSLLNPEQIVHLSPYRGRAPATTVFSRVNPGLEHQDLALSVDIYRFLLGQELYLRSVAEGLQALRSGYVVGWDEELEFTPPDAPDLHTFLGRAIGQSTDGIWMADGSNLPALNHPDAVEWLLDLPLSPGDARNLRAFASEGDIPDSSLPDQAAALVAAYREHFPYRANAPAFPYQEDGLRIIPPRAQSIVAV